MAFKFSRTAAAIEAILNAVANTSGSNTGDENVDRIGSLINSAALKSSPAAADNIGYADSADGNKLKKFTWANLKAALAAAFAIIVKAAPAGDVVGTTDTQALTNKTINGQRLRGNQSSAAQSPAAATRTYITGSAIQITASQLAVGTRFVWVLDITKTAAGTAASTFDICFGTAGSAADTARLAFTKPAGTGVIDCGRITIECVIRGPIGASGIAVGHFNMTHNLQTTGLATIPCVDVTTISSGFNMSTPTYIGLCVTTGASDAYTIQMVTADAWNL